MTCFLGLLLFIYEKISWLEEKHTRKKTVERIFTASEERKKPTLGYLFQLFHTVALKYY